MIEIKPFPPQYHPRPDVIHDPDVLPDPDVIHNPDVIPDLIGDLTYLKILSGKTNRLKQSILSGKISQSLLLMGAENLDTRSSRV